MSEAAPWSTRTQYIRLSHCGFAFWWFVILGIHLVVCIYHVAYAKLYWGLELMMFSFYLEISRIGMATKDYHTVAYVYTVLAAIHGVCALLMLLGSIRQRKLVFMPNRKLIKHSTNAPTHSYRVTRLLSAVYHRLGSHSGVLGVKGKHFHVVLICRELVEVALQSAQAIRMSKYLPRVLLNRFYVSLLVINCWSAVFVYSRWFWRDEARRRFAAIVCDCVLNLMTTIGVTAIIMLSYVNSYDVNNFDWHLLSDDEWFSQMLNEARVVLVMSWLDLASRAIFSLGLVATTADMKVLLRYKPVQRNRVSVTAGPTLSLTALIPECTQRNTQLVRQYSTYTNTGFRTRYSLFLLEGAHYAFAAWGVVILSLHLHASIQTPLFECTPKVYPMAGALPSCYTVRLDCYCMGISGLKLEIEREWSRFDRSSAVKLRFLHCASLEVPDSLQGFSQMQEMTMYNSTIVDWGDSAALTSTHHPNLAQVYIVRVNMTNSSLPLGLQSTDFPIGIIQMNFCVTNLKTLPDDLDTKWLPSTVVTLENSEFSIVPVGLIRSEPYYLTLMGNPLTELPPELFQGKTQYIFVGNTQVTELPVNVVPSTLSKLDITNTNISFFPSWIDPLVEAAVGMYMYPLIVAGGSKYCFDLEQIMSGESVAFSTPFQPEQSLLLMNASEANWELLNQVVDCSTPGLTQFSLDYFDVTFGLKSSIGE